MSQDNYFSSIEFKFHSEIQEIEMDTLLKLLVNKICSKNDEFPKYFSNFNQSSSDFI